MRRGWCSGGRGARAAHPALPPARRRPGQGPPSAGALPGGLLLHRATVLRCLPRGKAEIVGHNCYEYVNCFFSTGTQDCCNTWYIGCNSLFPGSPLCFINDVLCRSAQTHVLIRARNTGPAARGRLLQVMFCAVTCVSVWLLCTDGIADRPDGYSPLRLQQVRDPLQRSASRCSARDAPSCCSGGLSDSYAHHAAGVFPSACPAAVRRAGCQPCGCRGACRVVLDVLEAQPGIASVKRDLLPYLVRTQVRPHMRTPHRGSPNWWRASSSRSWPHSFLRKSVLKAIRCKVASLFLERSYPRRSSRCDLENSFREWWRYHCCRQPSDVLNAAARHTKGIHAA